MHATSFIVMKSEMQRKKMVFSMTEANFERHWAVPSDWNSESCFFRYDFHAALPLGNIGTRFGVKTPISMFSVKILSDRPRPGLL
jgi:hypothetical protein